MTVFDSLPPINFAALADALLERAEALLAQWLPEGHLVGHEWECGSLRGNAGKSCKVNVRTGAWADFASGEQGGDLVSLYAAIHGLSAGKAAVQLAHEYGLQTVANVRAGAAVTLGQGVAPAPARTLPPVAAKPATKKEDEGWQVLMPVPTHAPEPNFWHHARAVADIAHTARYALVRDGVEQLFGFVVRFKTSDGGKDTLPYVYCQNARNEQAWKWKVWPEPRPLYVPRADLGTVQRVVLVEGERKADVLQALLDATMPNVYRVASWAGGCKAWQKADWGWLAGRDVLLWPDADAKHEPLNKAEREAGLDPQSKPLLPTHRQPGMAAMLNTGALLRDTQGCKVQILPVATGDVKDGWDCADAIEQDGWDGEQVLAYFARAHGLPADATAAVPAALAEKSSTPVPAGADPALGGRDLPWWLAPYWDAEKCRWLTSRKMVIGCLENDPVLAPVLGFNEFTRAPVALVDWPFVNGKAGELRDNADLLLNHWLSKTYGLPSINRSHLTEAIYTVSHIRPYHPLRDWLEAQAHDGKARLDKWLIYALGYDPATMLPALAEYLALVGRFWLIGMVKRVFEPGCQFDYMPVLEGKGGIRKSTLIRTLVSDEYFSDTQFEVGKGKDGMEMLQGIWCYEIAELSHFSRSEVNAIKGFITSRNDRYRASYGRAVESHARQLIFVGTTNERDYLNDRTGNRRFWPVPCTDEVIKTEWVAKYRGQLFAEALAAYRAGAVCAPTREQEARLFAPMQDSRLKESAVEAALFHKLTTHPKYEGDVGVSRETVRLDELCAALGADPGKASGALQREIGSLMQQWGWERKRHRTAQASGYAYHRPGVWPPVDLDGASGFAPAGAVNALVGAAAEDVDDVPF